MTTGKNIRDGSGTALAARAQLLARTSGTVLAQLWLPETINPVLAQFWHGSGSQSMPTGKKIRNSPGGALAHSTGKALAKALRQ